ncbi:MAG: aminoacyl-tRNA hydrolase [Firmicutes bacterium]|nr:aminoacyl-tRNA hydrolase [Bacillota bacterium]
MKIIIGLGNFGDKYAYTYHNLGFLTVEAIAQRLGFSFKKRECDASVAKGYISGETVIIARPVTFMNLSGRAAYQLVKKYKAEPKDVLVIYDDADLSKGGLRMREKGGPGTHNGMRSIVEVLGEGFARLRIGIGKPEGDIAEYVLSEIPKEERTLFAEAIEQAVDLVVGFIKNAQ